MASVNSTPRSASLRSNRRLSNAGRLIVRSPSRPMQTGSWPSRAYGATPNCVTPNAHTFPRGQWPLISEQIIREGQHNPVEKHTGRYAVRRYLNVCTRIAHITCNVRSPVAVRVTLFKDRSDPSRK
jgi:hypothetical protein